MTCFNCEHKRPPDGYMDNQAQERQNRPPSRLERVPDRDQVSNAWNFDFDDDESDGADVAAFEYADPHAMNEDRRLDSPPDGNFGRPHEDYSAGRASRFQEKEHSRPSETKHSVGFDDFDDEDDDIDNYELDNQNRNERQETSGVVRFSDVENEGYSDESRSDDDLVRFSGRNSSSYPKSSKPLHHKGASSDTGDDDLDSGVDEDIPVHPKWKSSHVADSGLRDRASPGRFKQRSFVSDDDDDDEDDDRLVFGNDNYRDKGFAHKQPRGNYRDSDEGFRGTNVDRRGYGNDNYRDTGFADKQGKRNFRDSDNRDSRERDGHNSRQNRGNYRDSDNRDSRERDSHNSRQNRGNYRDSDEGGFNRGGEMNRSRGRGGFRGRQDVRSPNTNDFDRPSRDSGRSQRVSFDNGRGRGRGRGSDRSQRGSFDNGRGRGSDRSQRGSFDNGHGEQKFNRSGERRGGGQRGRGGQRGGGGRGGKRSDQTDDWSDQDNERPLRQRRNVR